MIITLDADLKADLKWPAIHQRATEAKEPIFWAFDFKFSSFEDQAIFYSYVLAIEEFGRTLWPSFNDKTGGVILYRGSLDILNQIEEELLTERANRFADYLLRLAAFLPETLECFCLFDPPTSEEKALFALLTSAERFLHIKTSLKPVDASLAILLPEDAQFNRLRFEKLLQALEGSPYRVIPQLKFNEMWDGVNEVIVLKETLSTQVKRQLQGFEAAGGEVKVFGAEGFEPPTHCSQSSCASQTALCSEPRRLSPKR